MSLFSWTIADPFLDNSRPDVGVVQRLDSPIIGLKNFNNWVKSVLITRFAHPVLAASRSRNGNGNQGFRGGGRNIASGKVLDMGCGKGGDMTKWAKARVKELVGVGAFSPGSSGFHDSQLCDLGL